MAVLLSLASGLFASDWLATKDSVKAFLSPIIGLSVSSRSAGKSLVQVSYILCHENGKNSNKIGNPMRFFNRGFARIS